MGTDVEELEIPVGELTFRARAAGPADGELVVLLHGFPQTSYVWRHQLPALAESGYRVVAPDQRGYSPGARPEGVEHYRHPHLVADVVAVADWLGGHNFHLAAHDWGAIVGWQVAGAYPDRLRSLTILGVPHPKAFLAAISDDPDQKQRSQYMVFFQERGTPEALFLDNDAAGLRAMFAHVDADAAGEYVRVLTEPGAMTAALDYYRAMDRTLADEIGPVTTPTLYIWSTDDIALGRAGAEATARYVDGPYRFEILEGVSHWIPEDAPEDLNRLLLEHLAAH